MVPAVLGLMGATGPALAGDQRVGDWIWNVDDPEVFVAGTENSAGHNLAQVCATDSNQCLFFVSFGINCEPDNRYTVLVNSDVGASTMQFLCMDDSDGEHSLVAMDFEAMDKLVRQASRVGFAIPMEGDDFKAVRFSLIGSNEAMDAMRTAVSLASEFQPGLKTRPAVERF